MKQIGLVDTQTLVTVPLNEFGSPVVEVLCPAGKYWPSNPDAPWNVFWSSVKADWVALYPQMADIGVTDPAAPWNQPEPDRSPSAYPDKVWLLPAWVPLVKIEKPVNYDPVQQAPEPVLVWFEDRVERQWTMRNLSQLEVVSAALDAGFLVMPDNFRLFMGKADLNTFNAQLSQLREEEALGNITPASTCPVQDMNKVVHYVTVARFREIMIGYGRYYSQLWQVRALLESPDQP